MNRRKFFSFLPALAALPAICKNMMEPMRFWEGTIVPRSLPMPVDAWRELEESEKRVQAITGCYQYSYAFVNSKSGKVVPTNPAWREAT